TNSPLFLHLLPSLFLCPLSVLLSFFSPHAVSFFYPVFSFSLPLSLYLSLSLTYSFLSASLSSCYHSSLSPSLSLSSSLVLLSFISLFLSLLCLLIIPSSHPFRLSPSLFPLSSRR